MKSKPSISSRATVRSLVVACMPAAVLTFVANSPLFGAAFSDSSPHRLSVDDNTDTTTNSPGTGTNGVNTNAIIEPIAGLRR